MPNHDINEMQENSTTQTGLLAGLTALLALGAGAMIIRNKEKDELEQQIQECKDEITKLQEQIDKEKKKGWFSRSNELIRSLEKQQDELRSKRNDLIEQYNEKYGKG